MSALDKCHYQIVHALENGGWHVEKLSPHLYDRETDSFVVIDIDASRPTNGSGHQQLYVEVKCFPGHNFTQELYIALGQYLVYRGYLRKREVSTPLLYGDTDNGV